MEYMEAGLPVVATAVGGLAEMIDDGVHGLLVPRRDPTALAAAVGALLDDPARRRELGAAARARRRAQFDLGVMVSAIEQLYEELYTARSRGS
jgi:glycosyltransferase involved in cell wall biosynthesis